MYFCPRWAVSFGARRTSMSLRDSSVFFRAHAALAAVALIYGLNYSLAKDVMPDYVLPRGFILIRATGASLLFWLVSAFGPSQKIERRDWPRLALAAFFGVAANQLLFFEGLNLTTPISASVIMTSNPIMVVLLSALLLKTPLRPLRIFGIALGLGGALVLISRGLPLREILSLGETRGNLLVLLNALSYAAYLVTVKPLMARYRALSLIRVVFLLGFFMVLPFGSSQLAQVDWPAMPPVIMAEIAFVVVGTTFLAYLLNVYALQSVSSTTVSFYIYLQPLVATAVALLLGKDQPGPFMLLSAAMIFAGVFLVSRKP